VIHTFRSNLIDEFTGGIERSHQHVYNTDPAFANSELPLKSASGQVLPLANFFPGANILNLMPNINFGTSNPASAGQTVTAPPTFGFDSRYPFEGTDTNYNVSNNLTWIKGGHIVKAGVYLEFEARGTPNYATYGAEGTYYFGSDTQNPYDTGYSFSNMLLGSVQAYGQDNEKLIAHGRYQHYEWFVQDSWKVSRRLNLDLGMRFQILVPFYDLGATVSAFQPGNYSLKNAGQLLFPAIVNGAKVALNPTTGATYPFARAGSFDPASYPAGGTPFSGLTQYQSVYFKTPPVAYGPRLGFAYDVFGNGKMAVRGGFGIFHGNAYAVDAIANMAGAPPGFQAPEFFNTTLSTLQNQQGFLSPATSQAIVSGSQNNPAPSTYEWSLGIQRDLGRGVILDVAYVGNVAHHQGGINSAGPPNVDINSVVPLTTWNPTTGVNPKYVDPTNSTHGVYATNLIRALSGGYEGYGAINYYEFVGESLYDALQVQLNRRFGRRLQVGSNYTWSKTEVYSRLANVSDQLLKNVVNRPQAVNVNFGYKLPDFASLAGWNHLGAKEILDGWNINGTVALYDGSPMGISCAASNVPANLGNYWTGTPTANVDLPFRCQMTGSLFYPSGTTPASVGSTANPRLWYPFDQANFVLPPANSLGIGNTPPTLTWGPGFENLNLSLSKAYLLDERGKRTLEFRAESFNTFNHFNPGNPNTSLTYNYATGAQTNAAFGSITAAANTPRQMSLSVRFRF
jgi:hypothetical protein